MTGQEVATRPAAQVSTLGERIQYARALSEAGLLPAHYRGRPANLLWAIEYGASLGISTMAAITSVHVIDGKPSASVGLIGGLVRRAGHTLRVTYDGTTAVATINRCDDPGFTFKARWDLERARGAGLTGKDNWLKYPQAMLKARAITEVARDACPEALCGLLYTPEELGAVVDDDGTVIEASATPQPSAPAPAPAPAAPAPPAPPDAPAERDWMAEAATVATINAARELWHEARNAGALSQQLDEMLTARAEDLTVSRATGEVVEEGTVVDPPAEEAQAA